MSDETKQTGKVMEALKASLAAEKTRQERIDACTRCDGHGWLTSWQDRVRCDCNPEASAETPS